MSCRPRTWLFRPDVFGRRFHGGKSAGAGDGQILRNCDMDEVHAEEKPIDHDEEMERDASKLGQKHRQAQRDEGRGDQRRQR